MHLAFVLSLISWNLKPKWTESSVRRVFIDVQLAEEYSTVYSQNLMQRSILSVNYAPSTVMFFKPSKLKVFRYHTKPSFSQKMKREVFV